MGGLLGESKGTVQWGGGLHWVSPKGGYSGGAHWVGAKEGYSRGGSIRRVQREGTGGVHLR